MDAQGALDSLLGRLTTVLLNEAQLLGGVRGDVEFIKDEMECMNSLILHLTDAQHRNHQVRTWTKQVVGLTRDCGGNVELYLQYVGGGESGGKGRRVAYLRRIPRFLRTIPVRHRIAMRIRELKARARDVGDRRLRYGVTVPPAEPYHYRPLDERPSPQPGSPEEEEDLQMREFLNAIPNWDILEAGTKEVLGWLSEEPKDGETWPRVIAIMTSDGMRPPGITSRVYERSSAVSSFQVRAWIDLDMLDEDNRGIDGVCREIVEQLPASPAMPGITEDGLPLLDEVREKLTGKK